jgi:superfamily I DNA/RNA helicase
VKYDLHGYHRLVTIEHDNARILVWLGSHDEVDRWLDSHRGAQFVVNNRGQIEFTRIECEAIDVQSLQETPPAAPLLSGPVLELLQKQTLAMLRLSPVVRLFFKLITFEQLIENDDLWQLIHAQQYDSDAQRSATLDTIDHLRHGRLTQAIARVEAYAGEATAAPAKVVAALEAGTASDTLANLSALTDEDFNHRFHNSTYADWLLFLHHEQHKHVAASHAGASRLIGVSGSGKTCVLVHRASALAARYPGERILILVLNESLRQLLERLVEHLCPESRRKQIAVMRIYDYCHKVVKTINPKALINLFDPYSGEDLAQCWGDFTNRPHAKSQSTTLRANIRAMNVDPWGYLHDELIWVRTGTGARKSERMKYLTVERAGRSLLFPVVENARTAGDPSNTTTGFRPDTRPRVLNLLKDYEEYMAEGGLLDEDGVALLAYEHRHHIAKQPTLRARCVLVDEAQDCSTTQLGVISLIPTGGADGLMLVGDPVQKVFPRQQHLKTADIDIRGRASRLSINYRNTRQILDAAYPIINAYRAFSPVPAEEVLEPELACRTGPRPQLIVCSSNEEQWQCVEALVSILRETGTPSVCVGAPRPAIDLPPRRRRSAQPTPPPKPLVDKTLLAICERRGWPVMAIEGKARLDALAESVIGARFEDMKGFEFRNVILVDLQDRPLLPDSIPFKEHWRVAFQLYVAMTRAQEGLWMFAVNAPSKLLASVRDFVDMVTPDQLLERPPRRDSQTDSEGGEGSRRADLRPTLPPIPTQARLPSVRPPRVIGPSTTDSVDEANDDEESKRPPLPFNPKRASVKSMIKYAAEYAGDLDVFERIMICLSDQDTSEFTAEMSRLREHWRNMIRSPNASDDENSDEAEWPSHAVRSQSEALSGKVFPHEQGMLSFMGYQVGMTSPLTDSERRAILRYVFHGHLPTVVSAGYTAEWGTPASATRYSKLRAVLSTFIENAMRRRIDMSVAIAEWQQDLVYIGQFRIT